MSYWQFYYNLEIINYHEWILQCNVYVCILPVMHISNTCNTTQECERSSLIHDFICRNHMILQINYGSWTQVDYSVETSKGLIMVSLWPKCNLMCSFQEPARRRPSMVLPWLPCSRYWGWGRVRPRNSCRWRRDSKLEPRPYGGGMRPDLARERTLNQQSG